MKTSGIFLLTLNDFIAISDWFIAASFLIMAMAAFKIYSVRKNKYIKRITFGFGAALLSYGLYMICICMSGWIEMTGFIQFFRAAVGIAGFFAVFIILISFNGFLKIPAPTSLLEEIEKHHLTQEKLKESIERFELVMKYAPIAKAIIGLDGKWISVNDAVIEMLGYSEKEILNLDFQSITHPDDLEGDLAHVNQLLEGKINYYRIEKRYFHKNGSIVWGLLEVSLMKNKEGKPLHFISQIVDITKRKEAEEKINQLNKNLESKVTKRTTELQHSLEDLENFAYTITHDLRVPVTNLMGLVDILNEDLTDNLNEEHKRIMDFIQRNIKKMDTLLIDLLDFARATKQDLKVSKFDLKTVMNQTYEELSFNYLNHKVNFSFKKPELPLALGDATALKQVCQNLISNALKYASKKEEIDIKIDGWRENGSNIYSVKDNGAGFDPAFSHKLFTLFQRLHKPSDFEGTGLGLAVSQRIVRKHGGKIWAESTLGEGATFYFSLPNS